jgi:hypothetical protein
MGAANLKFNKIFAWAKFLSRVHFRLGCTNVRQQLIHVFVFHHGTHGVRLDGENRLPLLRSPVEVGVGKQRTSAGVGPRHYGIDDGAVVDVERLDFVRGDFIVHFRREYGAFIPAGASHLFEDCGRIDAKIGDERRVVAVQHGLTGT